MIGIAERDPLLALLDRAGLELREAPAAEGGGVEYLVRGNTFAYRDLLKEQGGRWSGSRRAWVFTGESPAARLAAALPASPPPPAGAPPGRGLSDTETPPFAAADSKPHYWGHRQRLRDRFLEAGPDALADYELLELLLFFAVPKVDTKPLAKRLIERFGSLGGVFAAEPGRLEEVEQMGHFPIVLLKAIQATMERVLAERIEDRPVIGSWTALLDYLQVALANEQTEQFRVLFLDRKNTLIKEEVQQRGTVDHTPLYPREVVKRCLELAASAIIMVHNHPSGDPTPSKADVEMTQQVVAALAAVGITVHDHVVVGNKKHASFRAMKLI
ncbi:MAG TPA: DNA repair protein RadC [Geminicoccaceae bacterium]|nr:DNA repair protein RadC [Geminicoccaceae bacterium]